MKVTQQQIFKNYLHFFTHKFSILVRTVFSKPRPNCLLNNPRKIIQLHDE